MYAGKSKVKSKGRTPKGAGEVDLEVNSPLGMSTVVGGGGGRGLLSGSAPATPTETDSSCNQSTTGAGPGGGWSRNSLRGSKCNSFKDEKKKIEKDVITMYQTNQSTETDFIALARTSLKKFKTFLQTRLIFFSHFARKRGQDATVV